MPGPVSDAYDPEWSTADNAHMIDEALEAMYNRISNILGDQPPIYILDLVWDLAAHDEIIEAALTEGQWRLLRFALERARDSL
jgi:hypothetical protein